MSVYRVAAPSVEMTDHDLYAHSNEAHLRLISLVKGALRGVPCTESEIEAAVVESRAEGAENLRKFRAAILQDLGASLVFLSRAPYQAQKW